MRILQAKILKIRGRSDSERASERDNVEAIGGWA